MRQFIVDIRYEAGQGLQRISEEFRSKNVLLPGKGA